MTCLPRSAPQPVWRALADAIAARRQQALQREEWVALDDRSLRDLGLHRSEWQSVLAECSGDAEVTRRRVAPSPRASASGHPAWLSRLLRMRWTSAAAALFAAVSLGGHGRGADAAGHDEVAQRQVSAPIEKALGADVLYLPRRFAPQAGGVPHQASPLVRRTPMEQRRADLCTGGECRAVPAPSARAMTVEGRPELSLGSGTRRLRRDNGR